MHLNTSIRLGQYCHAFIGPARQHLSPELAIEYDVGYLVWKDGREHVGMVSTNKDPSIMNDGSIGLVSIVIRVARSGNWHP